MTPAEMTKEIQKLRIERQQILQLEEISSRFTAATTENVEEARPEYDFQETNRKLRELEAKIREYKHRLNVFNSTYVIEELGMTVDKVLVYLPQQRARMEKYRGMALRAPRERWTGGKGFGNGVIEYVYTNYDLTEAQRLYDDAQEKLARAQVALDRANTMVEMP